MSALEPLEHQPWEEAYQLAVLEAGSEKLSTRIETAKSAIAARIAELSGMSSLEGQSQELEAINKALEVLRLLAEHAPLRKTMVL